MDFALEAALSNYDEGSADKSEAFTMALEAFERAASQLNTIQEEIDSLSKEKFREVETAVLKFSDSLVSYTENENILELRIRLTKNKAVQKSEKIKVQLISHFKKIYRITSGQVINLYGQARERFLWIQSRFLLTAPTADLSREASDFLYYSNQKINNLPLIYKNLYQINPVKDQKLFVGRENELTRLDQAFEAWKLGNFASTVLIGEKWGGLTSLINHYLDSRKLNLKVIRIKSEERFYNEKDLLKEFASSLGKEKLNSFEELEKVILDWPTRIVLVVENLQKLFLRKQEGFGSLTSFLNILIKTNEKVFWLNSCTIYAWNYLKKVITIDEYFAHVIILDKLSDEQIINIIKTRNRISGVQIEFEPKESDSKNRKFRQKSHEEQQAILAKKYFTSLSEFAESNISLALIFWLISTKEFSSNQLIIGPFERPDLSFIKVMSLDRLLTILSLILHDGLTESELCQVNNVTLEDANTSLLFLLEDGIVRRINNRYQVNPIIYRNIISLLKNKNLLQN